MATDSDLLRNYTEEQSNAAFAEFVGRNLPVVYNAALRRLNGNACLADEVCQSVFTEVAHKASRLSRHPALLGWLHTSTRYAASALVRREHRRAQRERLAVTMHSDPSDSDQPSWETVRPLIDDALDRLNAIDRQAVLLRYFACRSFADIGIELQLSEEASRKRVGRALETIRRQFARHGVSTTATALALALTNAPAVAAPPLLASAITTVATTVTTGASAGIIAMSFMTSAKLASITTAVSIVGLAALGTALFTWSDYQYRTQGQFAATEAQVSAFRVRLRELESQPMARKPTTPASAPAASAATATAPKSAFVDQQLRLREILASSPEYAALHREETLLRVQRDFGGLLASHNYSSEQIRAVRDALVSMYLAQEEEWDSFARAPAGSSKRPDVATDERAVQILTTLRPVLPEDDITQLRRGFGARVWLRNAESVSADLSDAGIPISRTDERALAIVLSEAASTTRDPSKRAHAFELDPATGLTFSERAQLDDAAAFLTPPQLKIFEQYLRDERARSALVKRASS